MVKHIWKKTNTIVSERDVNNLITYQSHNSTSHVEKIIDNVIVTLLMFLYFTYEILQHTSIFIHKIKVK